MNSGQQVPIAGRVVDQSGHPVAEALVMASNPALERTITIQADHDGRFIIDADFRVWLVAATSENGSMMAQEWISKRSSVSGGLLELRIRPARRLAVRVTTGKPELPGTMELGDLTLSKALW